VVDDETALVSNANLTGRAMEDNLECGILIHGGPQPSAIRDHITSLYAAGHLRRILPFCSGVGPSRFIVGINANCPADVHGQH
jgi:hypothetical protein